MKMKKILSVTMLLALCLTVSAQTISVQVKSGWRPTIDVKLKGVSNCIAAGFSLTLPNGVSIVNSSTGNETTSEEQFETDHIVVSNQLDNTTTKAAIYSPTNSTFQSGWISSGSTNGDGTTLLSIELKSDDILPGTYQGQLKNIELAYENHQLAKLSNVSFSFSIEGVSTDIYEVDTDIRKEDVWYDLNGRKLPGKPNTKGIYIRNGHKVVIK
jgi:hypothetical protein